MLHDYQDELLSFLRKDFKTLTVVVMPDFFLDRLVNLNYDKDFFADVEDVAQRKGGSIDGIDQVELRGGNAINTASALAALGLKVTPIVCTSRLGLQLIDFYLKQYNVDTSHTKIFEKPSITTALEFKTKNGKVNVMLRDLGSLADFGPSDINNEDFKLIENADYVCLFNWAGTRSFGTQLAETVFRYMKTKGKGKTYYDTADPNPNKEKIPDLMKNVLQTQHVDILSVNENEAICYASQVSNKIRDFQKSLPFDELAIDAARILAKNLSARVDLHTTSFSATFTKKGEAVVPAFKVPVLRATGAGDAWNAGNILGDGHGLSDSCRLALANAVAAYYISNPDGTHPTRKQLLGFIQNSRS